ncbi:MAG: peptidase U32 family protein [Cetobacterium sp.]
MDIIAPAGNMERFYSAVKAGANEIYMGLKGFGARRNAENFTIAEYKEALDYAHERGVKVLLTLNTVMMDKEIEALYHNIKVLYEYGLDAVIVQDLGLFRFLRENFPTLELHGSTQMTVANHEEANYLKKIGFSRVVLPRELSFEEIKKVRENTDIELEIFVSGALCISYSGNCYLSSFIGGRSGNRGMCAQPCRKMYKSNNGEEGYLLSPKDQFLGKDEIEKLKSIGIDSIKLEGRMKDPNYVFETVSYYRDILNGIDREERSSHIFNRGYGLGYFYGEKENIINKYYPSSYGKEIGEILRGEVILKEKIILGDGITYLSKNFEKLEGTYINKIIKGSENVKEAFRGDRVLLPKIPKEAKYVFRSYAKEINDDIEQKLKKSEGKLPIEILFYGYIGKKPKLTITAYNNQNKKIFVEIEGDKELEIAQKKSLTENDILEKLSECGDTTFIVSGHRIEISDNIFMPISYIKSLRREAMEKLKIEILESYRRTDASEEMIDEIYREAESKKIILSGIVRNNEQKEALKKLGIEKIYDHGLDIAREGNLNNIDLNSNLACNLYQILKNKNDKITVAWNLNIANRYSFKELEAIKNIDTIILSPEVSYRRLEEIGKTNIKKAILGYSKPRGMYVEIPLFNEKETIIENEQGDKFTVIENKWGNSEVILEKPLNILKDKEYLEKVGIEEIVLEFINETPEEIEELIKTLGEYRAYNYERGVY